MDAGESKLVGSLMRHCNRGALWHALMWVGEDNPRPMHGAGLYYNNVPDLTWCMPPYLSQ